MQISAPYITGGKLTIGNVGTGKSIVLDSDLITESPIHIRNGNDDMLRFVTINKNKPDERIVLQLGGGLAEGTIDSTGVFTQEVLDLIAPPVAGSTGGIQSDATPIAMTNPITRDLTIAAGNPANVVISVDANDFYTSTNSSYTPPTWRVRILRSINDSGYVQFYDESISGDFNYINIDGLGDGSLNITIRYIDDQHGASDNDKLEYRLILSKSAGQGNDPKLRAFSISQAIQGGGPSGVASSATFPYVSLVAAGRTDYVALSAQNSSANSGTNWLRVPQNGFLPHTPNNSNLGSSSWNFANIYGINVYSNNSPVHTASNFGKTEIDALNVDADTLDGLTYSDFLRSNSNDHVDKEHTISFRSFENMDVSTGGQSSLEVKQNTSGKDAFMTFHIGGHHASYFGIDGDTSDLAVGGWSRGNVKYKVHHDNNFGKTQIDALNVDAGSVDNIDGTSIARNDAANTFTGTNTIQDSSSYPLIIKKTTNGGGVGIHFSDQFPTSSQNGFIDYFHSDGESYGSNNAWVFRGDQPSMSHVFDGGTNNFGMIAKVNGVQHVVQHNGNFGKTQIDALNIRAKTVEVSNSTSSVKYPIAWHNNNDQLFDTVGRLDFTPSTGELESYYYSAKSLGPNSAPTTDDAYVGGYGVMGNRGTFYISNDGGGVALNHDGVHGQNTKLETRSDGVDVTGTLTASVGVDTSTLTASVGVDTDVASVNKIKFKVGAALSDDAAIEWLGGSNNGFLRLSTSDDNGGEHIEFGDYDNTNQAGNFNRWSYFNRTGAYFDTNVSVNRLYVNGGNSSYIHMQDNDHTTRVIHCNSNRIGFLNSDSGWGAYCENDGDWVCENSLNVTNYIRGGVSNFNAFDLNGSWLRINDTNDYQSGIYCGSEILRTDGEFQVGGNGSSFKVTSSGTVTAAGTITGTDAVATSDIRVKEDLQPIVDAAQKLRTLRTTTHERTDHEKIDGKYPRKASVIAQDIERVLPEGVTYTDDENLGKKLNVSVPATVVLTIAAVNEHTDTIAEQAKIIASLNKRLERIEKAMLIGGLI